MYFNRILKELRIMGERLPAVRFWALWAVGFLMGLGYFIAQVRWLFPGQ